MGILLNMSTREQVKKYYGDFEKENRILMKQISSRWVTENFGNFQFQLTKATHECFIFGTNLGLKGKRRFSKKENVVSC